MCVRVGERASPRDVDVNMWSQRSNDVDDDDGNESRPESEPDDPDDDDRGTEAQKKRCNCAVA